MGFQVLLLDGLSVRAYCRTDHWSVSRAVRLFRRTGGPSYGSGVLFVGFYQNWKWDFRKCCGDAGCAKQVAAWRVKFFFWRSKPRLWIRRIGGIVGKSCVKSSIDRAKGGWF
jgi:hypothetical protein